MPLRLTSLAVIAAAVPAAPAQAQQRRADPPRPLAFSGTVTSVTVQQRMIIRVPRLPVARSAMSGASAGAPTPIRWVEKKTGKCIPVVSLAAAAVTGSDSVDLLLNGGKRLRARFGSDCPALDFYSGFYVTMPKDGKVCAARDSFRARSGGECRIKSFRALVPAK
jgi:hypothetical protein